jgi:CubicO group peptidase (beta-lactamase class C family)
MHPILHGLRALLVLCGPLLAPQLHAETQVPSTDPVALGIMQGFPPAPDRRVTRSNWMQFPALRWSMRNGRLLAPTANVRRGGAPVALSVGPAAPLDELSFALPDGSRATLADYARANVLDGLLVLHRGRVVFERYFDSMRPEESHGWSSMAKTVLGLLVMQLAEEGKLDLARPLAVYVPELAASPLGGASMQQHLT